MKNRQRPHLQARVQGKGPRHPRVPRERQGLRLVPRRLLHLHPEQDPQLGPALLRPRRLHQAHARDPAQVQPRQGRLPQHQRQAPLPLPVDRGQDWPQQEGHQALGVRPRPTGAGGSKGGGGHRPPGGPGLFRTEAACEGVRAAVDENLWTILGGLGRPSGDISFLLSFLTT